MAVSSQLMTASQMSIVLRYEEEPGGIGGTGHVASPI